MFEIKNEFVPYDLTGRTYANYEVVDGVKKYKKDEDIRFLYINKKGELHCTDRKDLASRDGDGVFCEQDAIKEDSQGYPWVDGQKYRICGADENGVFADTKHENYVRTHDFETEKFVVVVTHNKSEKTDLRDYLRNVYTLLEKKMKEVNVWGER